jgi:hypothetical protein
VRASAASYDYAFPLDNSCQDTSTPLRFALLRITKFVILSRLYYLQMSARNIAYTGLLIPLLAVMGDFKSLWWMLILPTAAVLTLLGKVHRKIDMAEKEIKQYGDYL